MPATDAALFLKGPLPPHLAKRRKKKGLAMLSIAMPGGGMGGGAGGGMMPVDPMAMMTPRRGEAEAWEAPQTLQDPTHHTPVRV